ncbi:MAG: saccharopine dehydrogenase NADP-binding domain-containing protein [Caldilineales bacterium]|nr:saccharopine dehydrogenase NADP-binding domain-containing protein [Caldilineales bacterium]
MPDITVLGAGLVGSAIIKDLAKEPGFNVTAVDLNETGLRKLASVARVQAADLRQPGVVELVIADSDLVVCAVPGFMGFETLRRIIETGKPVVDISFFPEDAFLLDDLARARGVTAVVDCGVAPGLCNLLLGYADTQLDAIDSYVCYVGGLPQVRHWPFEYKAVFSPIDVIEEYTRPARLIEYGQQVVRPALSDLELRDFPGIGTLEAFNTDGLRSLMRTMDIPFMKEKTLRYPGHAELMRVFRDSGFFDESPIDVRGQSVRPIDLTSRLLFTQWHMQEGEEDFTVMEVAITGCREGREMRYTFDLLDRYDRASQTTAMARTTGYTCAIAVRQVLAGRFRQPGIYPPEFLGRTPGLYEIFLGEYESRGIKITANVTEI